MGMKEQNLEKRTNERMLVVSQVDNNDDDEKKGTIEEARECDRTEMRKENPLDEDKIVVTVDGELKLNDQINKVILMTNTYKHVDKC